MTTGAVPPAPPATGSGAVGTGAGSAAPSGTAIGGTAQNVPAAVAKLPVDALLQATIQSKSGTEIQLQTALGPITVKLPAPLPSNLGDLLWMRVLTQPGRNDAANLMRFQFLPQSITTPPGGGGTTPSLSSPLIPGQTFNAITTTALSLPGGNSLPAGSNLQVMFIGAGTANPAQAANLLAVASGGTGLAIGGNMAGVSPMMPGGAPVAGGGPVSVPGMASGPVPVPGGIPAAGVISTPGAGIAPGSGTAPAPLILTGTILPANSPEARLLPDGFTALRTSAGVVGVKLPVPAPAGATVSFAVDGSIAANAARSLAMSVMTEADLMARGETAQLSRQWGSLQNALTTLAQGDPQAAALLQNNIPAAGPRLTATMVFFLSALTGSGGSLRGWVGDRPIGALETRDAGLAKKLEGDFATLRNIATEERSDGWRIAPMPFQMGDKIEQIRLAWRQGQEDEDTDNPSDDPGTRFLLDLSFSHIGHTQLDGLMKARIQHFDLIVRTENRLAEAYRNDIRTIFQDALTITGMAGGLLFQDGSRFVILPETPSPDDHGGRGIEA
ncbi:hypothetical protein [Thalassospira sp.]|uniref:hypothetical protein n=1 Tax=Thalassospira sp. TaxID=1912094 RepID=UPI002737045E|nr:hypothetical protein [Thalassospira sp.]MDP2696642.1 hypothetical protein [Thalassospira sp.]